MLGFVALVSLEDCGVSDCLPQRLKRYFQMFVSVTYICIWLKTSEVRLVTVIFFLHSHLCLVLSCDPIQFATPDDNL